MAQVPILSESCMFAQAQAGFFTWATWISKSKLLREIRVPAIFQFQQACMHPKAGPGEERMERSFWKIKLSYEQFFHVALPYDLGKTQLISRQENLLSVFHCFTSWTHRDLDDRGGYHPYRSLGSR